MAWPWIYCRAAVILIATFTVGVWAIPPATADPSQFEAAYYGPGVVTVFPRVGRSALDVALPKPLASVINLISFGPDGRSAYLQIPSASVLNHSDALVKIEFGPTRQSLVPGSAGLGDISSITVSPSGKIFVAASGGKDQLCGAYEIDPGSGTHHPLRVGHRPNCGGAMGNISPDGKRALSFDGSQLNLVNLETGTAQHLGTGRATWSPDGRLIAVASQGQITVIDANDLSRHKKLGASGVDGHLIWSPDSKRLLFVKSERRCFLLGDAESLATVDVESGRRETIRSSHCMVIKSSVGWIDPEAVPSGE
jgi:WD40 repeat protein